MYHQRILSIGLGLIFANLAEILTGNFMAKKKGIPSDASASIEKIHHQSESKYFYFNKCRRNCHKSLNDTFDFRCGKCFYMRVSYFNIVQ